MRCFYCDMPVSPGQYQDDHFPIPQRHGGKDTVVACLNCHSLKDRIPINRWPSVQAGVDGFTGLSRTDWTAVPPLTRIVIAKMVGMVLDGASAPRCLHDDCVECRLKRVLANA